MTVDLNIVPDCNTATLAYTQTNDEVYIQTETAENYFYVDFTHQYPTSYCPISYVVTDELGNNLDSIFTYDAVLKKITVN